MFDRVFERDVGEVARKLLDVLLPSDNMEYTEEDWIVHRMAEEYKSESLKEIMYRFVKMSLRLAVFSIGRRKVPGYYEVVTKMIIKAWPLIKN